MNTLHTIMAGHPRVGGEQKGATMADRPIIGSSPRGRGTVAGNTQNNTGWRVIPAWAGNSLGNGVVPLVAAGHPRVGGEQDHGLSQVCVMAGSSPRGRGTGIEAARAIARKRVIPAWAGNRRRHYAT